MKQERYAFIDTSRISLMVVGVGFHAATMFSPENDLLVKFDTRELLIDKLAGVVHVFRMEAFFVVAAFLASAVLTKYGRATFIEKRTVRLVPPFLGGLFVINVIAASVMQGQPLVNDFPPIQHLWFLPVLLALSLLHQQAFPPASIAKVMPAPWPLNKWAVTPLLTVAIGIACYVLECALKAAAAPAITEVTRGVVGGSEIAHFLPYYMLGAVLFNYRAHIDSILRTWPVFIPLALFNFSRLPILENEDVTAIARNISALSMTGLTLAFFRFAVPSTLARPWMSNFSFSLYLLHQPVLFMLRYPVMEAVANSYVRYFLVCALTVTACAALHFVISKSLILSFLFNGETKGKQPPAQSAPALQNAL